MNFFLHIPGQRARKLTLRTYQSPREQEKSWSFHNSKSVGSRNSNYFLVESFCSRCYSYTVCPRESRQSEQEEWTRLNEFFKRVERAGLPYWRAMWAPKGILCFQSRATRNVSATVGKSNRSTSGPLTTLSSLAPRFTNSMTCLFRLRLSDST